MPIYNYRCKECQHQFVLLRRVRSRNRPAKCDKCGVKALRVLDGQVVNARVWNSDKLYTNFGHDPIRFKTEQDLRRKCREMKVNSGALL